MLRLILVLSILLPLSGCVGVVQRQPNTNLVEELGADEARKKLKIVSTRANSPQIVDVEFNDVGFVYTYNAMMPMTLIPSQQKMSMVWDNLSRLDLYENSRVFLIGNNNRELASITFGNMGDAEAWVDLVLSLKADYVNNR